ncbi:hypothetical protein ACJMK2_034966 [Sinanodonta woodiana]|uniref:DUF4605 domain-containing protein n=1 Tax=Sinanodonta woodiana TaxID=1069815 RepID=A0ABD3WUU1_SINWO
MVKILSTGEIVADDDVRARPQAQQRRNMGGIRHDENPEQQYMQGQQVSIFDSLNQRLLQMGIPRWNLGPYTVEPIATVGVILAGLLLGLQGLLLAAILFLVVKWSQSNNGWRSIFGGPQGGNQGQDQGGRGQRGPGFSGGGGYRLGRS